MKKRDDLNKYPTCVMKRPDFREGKSIESKCIMTVVDHITQIPIEYHIDTTIISEYKIVRNYINYYVAALAESKVAFIQNSL